MQQLGNVYTHLFASLLPFQTFHFVFELIFQLLYRTVMSRLLFGLNERSVGLGSAR